MIEIKNKSLCSGCASCVNACPKKIIKLTEDEEGFNYPIIDKAKCIDCHLCEKACPLLNNKWLDLCQKDKRYPKFYAGQLKNKSVLLEVSSGGAFWAFAQEIIQRGGIVYGAAQYHVDDIRHIRVSNLEEAKALRRSKYLQSNIGDTYNQVKKDLKDGLTVLFSGTGCQIGGLMSFLGKDYDNLYTCDVVCHGVPSRKVWKAYRNEKEERESKKIVDLIFRDKSLGWQNNQYKIVYDDNTIEKEDSSFQLFHAGYLSGLFYRPSCGSCKFSTLPRISDITLADYWKYSGKFYNAENDLGVSLISVNSPKGVNLLFSSEEYLDIEVTKESLALSSCRHLDEHPIENRNRPAFFKVFLKHGYFSAAHLFVDYKKNPSQLYRAFRKIKRIAACLLS